MKGTAVRANSIFLSVRGFDGDVAERICLTYEFPTDNYDVVGEDLGEVAPLYTEASTGAGPNVVGSIYRETDLYQRAVKFYFNDKVQPLLPGWGIHSPSLYDRMPPIGGYRFALYTTYLTYGLCFPLTPFQRQFLHYHRVSPSMLPPNSWWILIAFEALCCMLVIRPTHTLFVYFYCFKNVREWYYLTA